VSTENTQVQVRRTYERSFAPGEVLFEEGDTGEVLYVIQSGAVELSRTGPAGRVRVASLGAGEFFGEMSVVVGTGRSARAVATAETQTLELDGETLEAMCMERPEIAIRIIRRLAARLIDSERKVSALGMDDLFRPIISVLLRLAEPDPEQGLRIPTTLRKLASEAGLSILEAYRVLEQLLDRKLLRLVDDVLVAPDAESLSGCLETPVEA
jgi:CRP-like cAMP-binding protein